jgi:hypothetical protein
LKGKWLLLWLPRWHVILVENYLAELKQKIVDGGKYADEHAKREQRRYVSRYNLRSRHKHFVVYESVLVLLPDLSSSKVFSKW